jgi:hypothetical protein
MELLSRTPVVFDVILPLPAELGLDGFSGKIQGRGRVFGRYVA